MGSRGPVADPLSIRSMKRFGNRRGGPPTPPVDMGKARMPRHLSPAARKFWRQLAPLLERRGHLTMLYEMAFASLCETWTMLQMMEEAIRRDGMVLTGPRGGMRQHPCIREKSRWLRLFFAQLRDFGLTPSSRRRLGITDPAPEEDEFFRMIDGGKKSPEVGE